MKKLRGRKWWFRSCGKYWLCDDVTLKPTSGIMEWLPRKRMKV